MLAARDTVLILATGLGATALTDLWLALLARLGVPATPIAWIGRWVGHLARGRLAHPSIAKATPVRGEAALGWLTHYAVGVAFAALLVLVQGTAWLREPGLAAAIAVGLATVVMPWFVMQPAMGAGIASARTPTPWKNRLRSLANHGVFGLGMYLTAWLAHSLAPFAR